MRLRALALTVSSLLAACTSGSMTPGTTGAGGSVGGSNGGGVAAGRGGAGAAPASGGGAGQAASGGAGGTAASAGAGGTAASAGAGGTAASAGAGGTAASGGGPAGAGGGSGGAAGAGGSAGTAGTASDGGQAGAGGAPVGGSGGAPACPGIVCEDFESGSIDQQKWDALTSGGTLTVETKQVAHGKYALQVHGLGSGSDDWAHLVVKNPPAALKGNTTYGRASMYFPIEAASSLHMSLPFAGHNGTGSANGPAPYPKLRRLELGTYFGGWQLGMDLHDVSPLLEDVSHPSGSWPTGKWFCLEWEFEDQPDRITVWVDGNKVGTFDNTNATSPSGGGAQNGQLYMGTSTGLIGGFDSFYLGFHDWHPTKAFDLYYDDVALDAKRIGCPGL
jgi:hypothetical protein